MSNFPLTLGIETSCDETSVGIIRNGRTVVSMEISSQIKVHQKYGGVVPEMASRLHVMHMIPTLVLALKNAKLTWQDIELVSATFGPGLLGAVSVGLQAAKTISYSLGIPLTAVHHLEGHIYANFLDNPDDTFSYPGIALIASGGHTQLMLIKGPFDYELISETMDDAVGEAFDKTARILGLGYPGGPIIDQLAQNGDPKKYKFPKVKINNPLSFSFSGLKTAALMLVEKHQLYDLSQDDSRLADFCASLQSTLVDQLINPLTLAIKKTGAKQVILAGGVAANSNLRNRLPALPDVNLVMPKLKYCTDNGAMIAAAGAHRYLKFGKSPLGLEPLANIPLAGDHT